MKKKDSKPPTKAQKAPVDDELHRGEATSFYDEAPDVAKTWFKRVVGTLAVVAIVLGVILLWILFFSDNKEGSREEVVTTTTITTSTAELPNPFGIQLVQRNPFEFCDVDPEKEVLLEDNPQHHIVLEMQPCWGMHYRIPSSWNGVALDWENGDKIGVWPLGGKMKIASSGRANNLGYLGRSFRVAGVGKLHLRPEKVRLDWLNRIVGERQTTSPTPNQVATSEELKTTEGTVVQWYPGEKALILRSKDGKETQFQATREVSVTVGKVTYGLGSQWILSTREGYLLDPGDVIRVRYYESTKNIVGIELLEPAQKELPVAKQDGAQVARIELLPTDEPLAGKVIRGVVARIEDTTLFVQTSSGYEIVDVTENTPVFSAGKQCYFEFLRVGDPVKITKFAGTNTVLKIEIAHDPETGSHPEGNPFESAYWKKNYFPSSR